MSFLLDTDTCSAYLKNDQRVVGKVMLHFGGLHLSVITVGEMDVLNGSVALVHNLTMVTHNTKDYANIPGLTLEDWLVP